MTDFGASSSLPGAPDVGSADGPRLAVATAGDPDRSGNPRGRRARKASPWLDGAPAKAGCAAS
jgi:hypothetical protein